jgi:hypothetical protein
MPEWTSSNGIVTYEYPAITPMPVPRGHHRQHKGLITTTAVRTQAGWLGQVLADQKIVWETEPQDERETALELADERVANVLEGLFAGPDRQPAAE